MLMVSIIMILGVVRTVASWREGDTVSEPKQLETQGEQGEIALNHQNTTVTSD